MGLFRQLVVERILPGRRAESASAPEPPPARANGVIHDPDHQGLLAAAAADAKAGSLAASLRALNEGLAQHPADPALLYARALTLFDWGRMREAHRDLVAAQALGLASFGLNVNLAQTCHLLGMADMAERHARLAIAEDATVPLPHLVLATSLQGSKRFAEAMESYSRAFELAPERLECLTYIASCQLDLKNGPAAEATIRKLLDAQIPARAKSWALLGIALSLQEREAEALDAFERAEEIEACTHEMAETFVVHGFALFSFGRIEEAIALYERHLPTKPHEGAFAHYGFCLLSAGRFVEGWDNYEFRRVQDPFLHVRPRCGRPAWDGQDVRDRTLLLWAEQGIGDTVQFARYARLLRERGANLVLHMPERLKAFACGFLDVDRVILDVKELDAGFDYQIPTMSVPRVLASTEATIPSHVPYFRVAAEHAARWRGRIQAGKLNVGLVWAGNPKHENDARRSMRLASLRPLFDVEGIQFYSLQKDRPDIDLPDFPSRLIDLAPELHDLRDASAAIAELDLVISVDTAVAHVAGALGKPVWLLIALANDFRWLREREDSPWYPSMRIFRQERLGDWDGVVTRVRQALRNAAGAQSPADRAAALAAPQPRAPARSLSAPADVNVQARLCRVRDTRYGLLQYPPEPPEFARSLEHYGEWLQPQLDLLAQLVPVGAIVVEAGSDVGAHLLALVSLVGPEGHVMAYESHPIRRRLLAQNIQANRAGTVPTLMVRRLGPDEARDPRPIRTDGNGASRVADDFDTLDDLALDRLDLVKINEGEPVGAILQGGTDTLWRLRPALLMGIAEASELNALVELVKSFGYRCWRMETALFQPGNFNRREDDIFGGRTALALVAIAEERAPERLDGCVEV